MASQNQNIHARLEELRTELRAERISYGELAELQSLSEHIAPGDMELLEAAGVPEEEAVRRLEEAERERDNLGTVDTRRAVNLLKELKVNLKADSERLQDLTRNEALHRINNSGIYLDAIIRILEGKD
jgi:hypothetical protein